MTTSCVHRAATLVVALATAIAGEHAAFGLPSVDSTLAYQGQLRGDGIPLNDPVDLIFSLFDAAEGGQLIASIDVVNQPVSNGLFTVELDFGPEAFGGPRWLEVSVRSPHDPTDTEAFETLSPRQAIRTTPFALHANSAVRAGTAERPFREEGVHAVFEGGNVGIGTATPGRKLHVAGGGTFEGGIFLNTFGRVEVAHENNTGMVIDPSENTVSLEADNSIALTANVSLDVGIGTTAPLARTHVVDAPQSVASAAVRGDDLIVEDTDAVLGLYSGSDGSVGSVVSLKEMQNGSMTDNWTIWRGSSGGDSALHISYGTDPAGTLNPDAVTITPAGNMGVGVLAPQTKLQVDGEIRASRLSARTPGVDGLLHIYDADGNIALRLDSDNYSAAPQFAMFGINGTSETVEIVAREGDGAARMMMRTEAGDNMIEIDALESGGAALKLLDPGTKSVSVSLNSRNGGRVGIGTSNPGGALHVAASNGNQSVILPADAIGSGEMLNEAGVSSNRLEGIGSFNENDDWVVVAKSKINCPSSGFIVAFGTVTFANSTLGAPTVEVGLTTFADNIPGPAAIHEVTVPGVGASATASVHSIVKVSSAGQQEVKLSAQTNGAVVALSERVTLIFVPTAYGDVN